MLLELSEMLMRFTIEQSLRAHSIDLRQNAKSEVESTNTHGERLKRIVVDSKTVGQSARKEEWKRQRQMRLRVANPKLQPNYPIRNRLIWHRNK